MCPPEGSDQPLVVVPRRTASRVALESAASAVVSALVFVVLALAGLPAGCLVALRRALFG